MKQQNRRKDIAIIGMSCRFSSTENLADYWKSLVNGDELVEVVEHENTENPAFIDVHSRMQDVESFDYPFFGYTIDEARIMDPQIRVMHQQAWLAFENAGYDISKYKKQVGVFLSASDNVNWRAHSLINSVENVDFFKVKQLSNKNFLSTLISYSLNLRGPSYYIDTACSSSLSSIHIACRNLLMGECAMALAGGVSINTHVEKGYEYTEGMILSKDGHCRAFDADSSGTISGEGVGVVVLKRYDDAIRDGDHIYAVVRSSAANNDGKRKVGYTAPSIGGQSDCITLAHKIAGIQPNEVSYVEAHGTGTKIGDVIEIESLNKAFQYDTNHKCAVGTVKSNMGHLDAAAGVAALIKTSLMLENELLVPSLHFKSPNPEVNFKSGPFFVNTETKPWQATEDNKPLIAGVSSFGIGGTNVHVLLESHEKPEQPKLPSNTALITYSAASVSSVNAYEKELSQFIKENDPEQLQAISYSLNTGRKIFDYRKFVVVESINDEYTFKYGNLNTASAAKDEKIAFAISGQGTQYYQMGKDLYESEPSFRAMMDKGFAILSENSSVDYKSILGYVDSNYDPEFIHNTLNTQPLLFLFEYCIAKLLMNLGAKPSMLIGLSQGEYCAACLSGVFSFEDGLRIMEKRAELMDSIEKGMMVAVNAPYTEVEALLPPEIQVAVINTATSCVISGTKESVQRTLPILEERDFDYTVLKISISSHSKMMEPILEEFAAFFHDIPLHTPQIPFISSSTGAFISDENATSATYWANHIRNSVNFLLGSQEIIRSNPSCIIEISPGASISNLIQVNNPEANDTVFLQSVRNAKEVANDYSQMLQLVGQLWQNGISVNWDSFYNNQVYTKVPCPTYCFDKYTFNARVNVFDALGGFNPNSTSGKQPKDWLYTENWKEISIQPHVKDTDSDWVVCFVNEHSISQNIRESFEDFAGQLYIVKNGDKFEQIDSNIFTINPKNSDDYEKLGEQLSKSTNGGHGKIIHSWSIHEGTALDFEQCQDLSYFSLQYITRFIIEELNYETLSINVIGNDLFKVYGHEVVNYNFCTLLAAVKTIPKEYENVVCRFIEYSSEYNSSTLFNDLIKNQFAFKSDENVLAIRGEKAWTIYHDKVQISDSQQTIVFKENGCYLITGASGGIGQVISRFLISEYNAKLILVGRSEIAQSLSDILSENVKYVQSNIEDEKRLQDGIAQAMYELNEKTMHGVFHTAGIGDYSGLIRDRSRSDCERLFSPKIAGSIALNNVSRPYKPTFLMLFSSLAALKNPFGQIGYSAANTYQNFMAKNETSNGRIISVLWDTWKESGMALKSDERISVNVAKELDSGISNEEGMDCIQLALQSNLKEVIVSTISIEKFKEEAEKHTLFAAEAMINEAAAANHQYSPRPNINIEYMEPKTELEIQIAELWSAFFGYDKIGLQDNFFELGGDSLKAMTILKRIEQITGLEIKLKEFYVSPTVESIAKEIQIFQEAQELQLQKASTGKTLRI